MSRAIALTPIFGCPPAIPSGKKFGTGTTFADTAGNAVAGDVVWAALFTSAPSRLNLAPLDSACQALIGGSVIVTAAQVAGGLGMLNTSAATFSGGGASGGACLDAGN
jgi:hypothetical protein